MAAANEEKSCSSSFNYKNCAWSSCRTILSVDSRDTSCMQLLLGFTWSDSRQIVHVRKKHAIFHYINVSPNNIHLSFFKKEEILMNCRILGIQHFISHYECILSKWRKKPRLSSAELACRSNYWVPWQSSPAVLLLAINVQLMENMKMAVIKEKTPG